MSPVSDGGHDGSIVVDAIRVQTGVRPGTSWRIGAHDAGGHGRHRPAAGRCFPGGSFPFPKSLYAVEDALRFFVADKPDAVVLDFFAGSGTTAHAVMRLNRQDGGRRQSIMVTNNEVSADEAKSLTERGFHEATRSGRRWASSSTSRARVSRPPSPD